MRNARNDIVNDRDKTNIVERMRDHNLGLMGLVKDQVFNTKLARPIKSEYKIKTRCDKCNSLHHDDDAANRFAADLDIYRTSQTYHTELFRYAAIIDAGIPFGSNAGDVAFNLAWENGHSAGLHEVVEHMGELGDLYRAVMKDLTE